MRAPSGENAAASTGPSWPRRTSSSCPARRVPHPHRVVLGRRSRCARHRARTPRAIDPPLMAAQDQQLLPRSPRPTPAPSCPRTRSRCARHRARTRRQRPPPHGRAGPAAPAPLAASHTRTVLCPRGPADDARAIRRERRPAPDRYSSWPRRTSSSLLASVASTSACRVSVTTGRGSSTPAIGMPRNASNMPLTALPALVSPGPAPPAPAIPARAPCVRQPWPCPPRYGSLALSLRLISGRLSRLAALLLRMPPLRRSSRRSLAATSRCAGDRCDPGTRRLAAIAGRARWSCAGFAAADAARSSSFRCSSSRSSLLCVEQTLVVLD